MRAVHQTVRVREMRDEREEDSVSETGWMRPNSKIVRRIYEEKSAPLWASVEGRGGVVPAFVEQHPNWSDLYADDLYLGHSYRSPVARGTFIALIGLPRLPPEEAFLRAPAGVGVHLHVTINGRYGRAGRYLIDFPRRRALIDHGETVTVPQEWRIAPIHYYRLDMPEGDDGVEYIVRDTRPGEVISQ